ncbi:MAG: LacI family transcriptional regulator [Bifidobacteriaceae bacterium]|jgi:LacI family transcriptional regulator|nr:LacI family transcriptional regulator [Bifidobacteriaceae bacterium]
MGSRRATIYEVSERAGVSISTVSLAINHPERVKEATRRRILQTIDELGFVPKELAVARARAGLGRIAVVAPFTSYLSFSRRLAGMLAEAAGQTQIVVYDHEDVATSSSPLLATMPVRGHVDGLVIMGVPLDQATAERLRRRLPTVLVDIRHAGLTSIYVDDVGGGQMVGEHLRQLGHQRVAFVREAERSHLPASPTQQRKDGLVAALGAANVQEIVIERGPGLGERALAGWADLAGAAGGSGAGGSGGSGAGGSGPTAIVAHRDLVAVAAVAAARRAGFDVPRDLSVVGFDDDLVAQETGLTTVGQPFEESGALAFRLVRDLMADPAAPPVEHLLPLKLAIRQTTAPPPKSRRGA